MKKVKKYVELHIHANALVPKGAVGVESVFKADGSFVNTFVPVQKFDDDKMEMYTILYMLNREDSQGYICDDPEVLAKARDEFVQSGGLKKVKLLHDGIDLTGKAFTCELWTVKQEVKKTGEELDGKILEEDIILRDPVFPDEEYIGALAVCTKFDDEELWNKVKLEKWETSIEGQAKFVEYESEKEEEVTEKQLGFIAKVVKAIMGENDSIKLSKAVQEKLSKDFLSELERDENDLWRYIYMLWNALWEIEYDAKYDNVNDPAKLVKESIVQFQNQLLENTEIFKKPETVKKGDDDMEKKELIEFLKSDEGKALIVEASVGDTLNKADTGKEVETVVNKMVEDGKLDVKVADDVMAKINSTVSKVEELEPKIAEVLAAINDDGTIADDIKKNNGVQKPFVIESSI